MQERPSGFYVITLPFKEDIRLHEQLKCPNTTSDKDVEITTKLVKKMRIEYDAHNFPNPSLQLFYEHLQAHALDRECINTAFDSYLTPDYEQMENV